MAVGQIIPPYSTSRIKVVLGKDFVFKGEPILGRYLKVNFKRKGKDCIALLRVVDIQTENRTLVNAEMAQNATLIENIKERIQKNDVLTIDCEVLTAFEKSGNLYRRVNLDTIINSLEDVEFVDETLITQIIDRIRDNVFYLGKAIDEEFDVPLVFLPFYVLNEAYHMLISGQTGSGKSTEAKKILVAYAKSDKQKEKEYREEGKQYRSMNFLVLDPVGEFTKSFQGRDTGHFALDLGDIWNKLGKKKPEIYSINKIALDRWDMLEELIRKKELLKIIAIKGGDNQDMTINILIRELRNVRSIRLSSLKRISVDTIFEIIRNNLERIYTQENKRREVATLMDQSHIRGEFQDKWEEIADWFDTASKRQIRSIIRELTRSMDKTVIIDLSSLDWEDPIKFMIIYSIFSTLVRAGEEAYQEDDILNTMVVIDEAHRIVPARLPSDVEDYNKENKREGGYCI